jgi:uncharacterized membrane-anchored protein YjiN (DUF445 family)
MGDESKQTYAIRVLDQMAMRLEEAARVHGITPTSLIQSIISRKFRSPESADRETGMAAETAVSAKLENLCKSIKRSEEQDQARFNQLRFEIVKTRAALLHSLDQTLSSTVVDQIIEASEQTAREYIAGANDGMERKS